MNLDENHRKELIKYRLTEATETIQDVQLLLENDRLKDAVNKIYYGMFYSSLALGLAYEFETSKNQELIRWYNKNFINEELIETKYDKIINKASNRKTQVDYDSLVEFEKIIVLEMFEEMKEFISKIEKFLEQKL